MLGQTASISKSINKHGHKFEASQGNLPIEQKIIDAAVAANDSVLALTALADGVVTTVTAGITSPDVYRTPSMVAAKTGVTPVAGNVTIYGTDWNDHNIYETKALNDTTPVLFDKAFKTITKIVLPAWTNDVNDEVSVGVSDKLGLCRDISVVADVQELERAAAAATSYTIEGTGPTVNATHNTILPNGGITADDSFKISFLSKAI
jgi:hypothetical protein